MMTKIIAHRGASGITGEDNTLESFKTAWMMGCDLVEFDIRKAKCGALVCFHDDVVKGKHISDLTLKELRTLSGCDVPLLEEAILECKGHIRLDIEIKETGFEQEVLDVIQKYLDLSEYTIKSFSTEVVRKIAELDDSIIRGLLMYGCKNDEQAFIDEYTEAIKICKPHFLSPKYTVLEPWFLEYDIFKLPLWVWTVNDPKIMQKIVELNVVDAIITDRPDYMAEVIKRSKKNLTKDLVKEVAENYSSSNLISLLEESQIDDATIDTRHIVIGHDIINEIPAWVNAVAGKGAEITIISDHNTAVYAEQIIGFFEKKPHHIALTPLDGWAKLTPHISFCEEIADQTKNNALLISCGSGTINDLTKYAAHLNNIPYISCATAASMNGYTSSIAALLIKGLKSTINCPPPVVLISDINIIAQAPEKLAISGYSDLLSKPMSTSDWRMSNILFDVPYDDLPSIVVSSALEKSIEVAKEIKEHNPVAIERLMECLVLSGFSMTLAGSSAPASGGEHLIGHYLDMKNYSAGQIPALHGEQVAIGTLISALLYQKIIKIDPNEFTYTLKTESELEAAHQDLWQQVKAEAKQQIFDKNEAEARLDAIRRKWNVLCDGIDNELWSYDKVKDCLIKGGAELNPDKLGINRQWLESAIMHAADIRNRYTILHLASEIGLLSKVKAEILQMLYT